MQVVAHNCMKQRGPKLLVIHEQAVWTGRGEDPRDHGEEVSVTQKTLHLTPGRNTAE